MHLVTLAPRNGRPASPGVLIGDEALDLSGNGLPASLRGILEGGPETLDAVRRLADAARRAPDPLRASGALAAGRARLAPIADPQMILAAGMNYHSHLKEMNGTPTPERPSGFMKIRASLTGPDQPITIPALAPGMVDWEGELTVVIGRPCYNVSVKDALSHVAGYTMANDVSARDWVPPVFESQGIFGPILAWERNLMGKQFPGFCPVGPAIATADEIPDITDLHIETRVNGTVMQSCNTNDLVFGVAELLSYFSQFYAFAPGDLLLTGSPPGVGFGRNPKIFLKPGDVVECIGDHIGTLRNTMAAA
jgi:acylpyruvate hydrolase